MLVEKETKTSKCDNIFQKTLINITHTFHWSSQQVKDTLLPFDITQQQYNVLKIIRNQYPSPSTIGLIQAKIVDKMSDTSRIVDRLIQKGYVKKTINKYDKRAVDIIISDDGLSLLKEINKKIDFSTLIAPNLTTEEAERLNLLLEKMRG
ncbi:MarR family winged helix-turn-helix transcriptional regulator [Pedobacter boryungensis]|uniref:MarR family transcriptional regulator n=1 Tax=Pedobacter boryungensis TaxID=869962 RepID=A0ABX2DBZ5_9SPHI|nr:MarR family transcriptional regulator [Pedobacter boryungensis]NQX31327.1 MarR family transcriptional regulator [Pedobacter boryungensis]